MNTQMMNIPYHSIDAILFHISQAPWIKFDWLPLKQQDSILERAAITVTGQLVNSDQRLKFQLDTGTPASLLYENPARKQLPKALYAIADTTTTNLTIQFDGTFQTTVKFGLINNFGEHADSSNPFPETGTLGLDFFTNANAGFAIDYKKQQIYILSRNLLNNISAQYSDNFFDYQDSLQKIKNKILLPFKIGNIKQLAFFDTGSSMFELVVSPSMWKDITALNLDSPLVTQIEAEAWGNPLILFGAEVQKEIYISGRLKRLRKVYTFSQYDGPPVIGNALFFDDVIVVNIVNKKFGIFPNTV
jgi:hypothetical protein